MLQVGFHHQTDNGLIAFQNLVGNVFQNQRLQGRVFVRVFVAAVIHDSGGQIRVGQGFFRRGSVLGLVVRLDAAATQYDRGLGVATGRYDGYRTVLVDGRETVRVG